MKELLERRETRQMTVLIGLAIVCGIAVHHIFFIVAQILALATCFYLMGCCHARTTEPENTHTLE